MMQERVRNPWTWSNIVVRFGQEVWVGQVELRFLPLKQSKGLAELPTGTHRMP